MGDASSLHAGGEGIATFAEQESMPQVLVEQRHLSCVMVVMMQRRKVRDVEVANSALRSLRGQ